MAEEIEIPEGYENEIIIGKTRCLWKPTNEKGTIVRVWADFFHGGCLMIDVRWDKDGNEQPYLAFDKELKLLSEDESYIVDKENYSCTPSKSS